MVQVLQMQYSPREPPRFPRLYGRSTVDGDIIMRHLAELLLFIEEAFVIAIAL